MVESGRVEGDDEQLVLLPSGGRISYRDSCVPSLDSDKPIRGLPSQTLRWELVPDERQPLRQHLRFVDRDGAVRTFRAEPMGKLAALVVDLAVDAAARERRAQAPEGWRSRAG